MNDGQEFGSRRSADLRILTGGLVWMCAIQFFVAQVVAQVAWSTPFSLATNFISDLGNTACANYPLGGSVYVCSPMHAVMNMSFSLQGVIILVGLLLIHPLMTKSAAKIVTVILFVLTGLGMLGVGIFPENENNTWHVYSAAVQFVTGNVALIIVGVTNIFPGAKRSYLMISILMGSCGLVATCLFPSGIYLGIGVGGMERVAAYTFPIWLIGTGGVILKRLNSRSSYA
ncbi:MAG: DUF998 domain-containing protein [Acidobacteriota bacterium]